MEKAENSEPSSTPPTHDVVSEPFFAAKFRRDVFFLFLAAIVAACILKYAMPFGATVMHGDSYTYVQGAQHLMAGEGYVSSVPPEVPKPVVHFPPLYSLVLASVGLLFEDIYEAAKWLNMFCFVASVFLLGCLVYAVDRRRIGSALAAMLLFGSNPLLLRLHSFPLSEPLFLSLGLAGQLALIRYAMGYKIRLLICAAICFGLACVTRYSGVVWIASGIIAVWLFADKQVRQRCFHTLIFVVVAFLPAVIMLMRNRLAGGSAANRGVDIHWISSAHLTEGISTVAAWFLPWRFNGWFAGMLVSACLMAGAVISIVLHFKQNHNQSNAAWNKRAFLCVSLIFITLYLVHLFLAVSFVDFSTPLDSRILAPVQTAVIGLIGFWIACISERWLRLVGFVSVGGVILLSGHQSHQWMKSYRVIGEGYRSAFWKNSPVAEALRQSPTDIPFYSNKPEAVYLLSGRPVRMIPWKKERMTTKKNESAQTALLELGHGLKKSGGMIVYFYHDSELAKPRSKQNIATPLSRLHEFSAEELEQALDLQALVKDKKAVIYKLRDPA